MSGLIIDLSSNELNEHGENSETGKELQNTWMVLSNINSTLGKESNIDSLLKQIIHFF